MRCLPALNVIGPPLAVEDTFIQSRNGPTEAPHPGILANDTLQCPSAVVVSVVEPPAHGTLDLRADGSFTYTPEAASTPQLLRHSQQDRAQPPLPKADSFTYQVSCPATGLVSIATAGMVGQHRTYNSIGFQCC